MNCIACGHENRAAAKFCEECATPLKRVCGKCQAELRPTAKFCDECGAPVGTLPTVAKAYRQLLKGTRAELHIRFADWALGRADNSRAGDSRAGDSRAGDSGEHDETLGWHLEQAHQFLRELGPLDAGGLEIGERASSHLAAAGRRALAGDDVPLAASLLGRAIERLEKDDERRAELALDWCEALLASGDVAQAQEAIDELGRFVAGDESREAKRLGAWQTCFVGHHTVLTAPEELQTTADKVARAANILATAEDSAGEAKAHYVHALALSRLGKIGPCEATLDLALAAARRVSGDRRRANTVLAIAPLAALWGPSPVTRASGRCLDVVRVLRITQGAPAVEAVALSCRGCARSSAWTHRCRQTHDRVGSHDGRRARYPAPAAGGRRFQWTGRPDRRGCRGSRAQSAPCLCWDAGARSRYRRGTSGRTARSRCARPGAGG